METFGPPCTGILEFAAINASNTHPFFTRAFAKLDIVVLILLPGNENFNKPGMNEAMTSSLRETSPQ